MWRSVARRHSARERSNYPSLKLRAKVPEKWWQRERILSFWDLAYFQGQTVSFRECNKNPYSPIEIRWKIRGKIPPRVFLWMYVKRHALMRCSLLVKLPKNLLPTKRTWRIRGCKNTMSQHVQAERQRGSIFSQESYNQTHDLCDHEFDESVFFLWHWLFLFMVSFCMLLSLSLGGSKNSGWRQYSGFTAFFTCCIIKIFFAWLHR